ncbi:MAG: FtsK/SpoIIIE family DNA translocase [Thermomicrobiales bacterium]
MAGTATTPKRRSNASPPARRPTKSPRRTPPRARTAPRKRATTRGPRLEPWKALHPGLRRDLIGVGLIVLALLSIGALLAGERTGLLDYWRRALVTAFGWGAVAVPALIGVWAADAFMEKDEKHAGPSYHALVGSGLIVFAILGLLHSLSDAPLQWAESHKGGGYLGYFINAFLMRGLGAFGAGVVLLALLIAGIAIFMNNELRYLLTRLRGPERTDDGLLGALPIATMPTRMTEPLAKGRNGRAAVLDDIGPAPQQVLTPPPIIRRPEAKPDAVPDVAAETPQRTVRKDPPAPPAAPATKTGPTKEITDPPIAEPMRWTLPTIAYMDRYPDVSVSEEDLEQKAQVIEQTLASFRVEATVREINPGPAVTQYALEPGIGVKVRRVTELQNDLALALAVPALRIEAPIPGKSRIGIEIPNTTIATVGLREALESSDFAAARAKLPIPLGRDVNGRYQVADLTKMPHLLVAGSTGSGKSIFVNVLIAAMLLNRTPDELRFVMVDPKMVEMSEYNGIPHLLAPVVTDMEKVIGILRWAVTEMERRYQLFMRSGVRNIEAYHKRSKELGPHLEKPPENIPYVVIIIDELADLMMTAPDDIETALVRLAQKARATGMHLILATQRPSVDVITGLIKANFPARIAFAVTSQIDSRVILDTPGAERLLGRGDMLYKAADSDKPQRIQGAFVSDKDISAIVSHWRILAPEPQYKPEVVEPPTDGKTMREEPGGDNLIDRARQLVREQGWASTSMLQSRLRIGYNRAARLIEALEREGVIGPQDGARRRQLIDGESAADDYSDDEEE